MPKATVIVADELCKGVEDCGLCVEVCPENVFAAAETGNARGYVPSAVADAAACTGCEACMRICPDFAVIVEQDKQSKEAKHA